MKPERLHEWSERIHGARLMLLRLRETGLLNEPGGHASKDDKLYNKAIVDLILSSIDNTTDFLAGSYSNIRYTGHEHDKKGRLISVQAYFEN